MNAITVSQPSVVTRSLSRLGLGTTSSPDRLRAAAIVLALALLAFGIVAFQAISVRRDAAVGAATQAEPLLIATEGLYASLADADATAATTFVTGGLEPAARRARYIADLGEATRALSVLARQVNASPLAQRSVQTITMQLPVYTGLVESARANNRQGFPVGAAYLRRASTLMRTQILPSAAGLYSVEAQRLGSNYSAGVSLTGLLALIAVAVVLLGLLVTAQLHLASLTHRIISVPMAVATLVGLLLTLWSAAALVSEQSSLVRAQRDGSDAVQLLAAARVLVLRAQGDESLALVARGGDTQDLADFDTATRLIARPPAQSGLLAQAAGTVRRGPTSDAIRSLASDVGRYQAVHRQVATLELGGRFLPAVALAVGPGAPELTLADHLNTGLNRQIAAAQQRFTHAAGSAAASTDGLPVALPLLTIFIAALTLYALLRRIGEYR